MIASETPALSPRVRGCAIVAVATLIMAGATAAALFFATDTFFGLTGDFDKDFGPQIKTPLQPIPGKK